MNKDDASAKVRFQRVNEAYSTLKDATARSRYDAELRSGGNDRHARAKREQYTRTQQKYQNPFYTNGAQQQQQQQYNNDNFQQYRAQWEDVWDEFGPREYFSAVRREASARNALERTVGA